MGLRIAEFEVLTPSQFDSIYRHWRLRQDGLSRERWEIARMVAMYAVSPYAKKRIKPTDLIRFPWEEPGRKKTLAPPSEKSTKERFLEINERWK